MALSTNIHSKTLSHQPLINYLDSQDNPQNRRPIVLIHGTSGTAERHFGQIIPQFAKYTRVIAPTWSEPDGETLTLEDLSRQIIAVIQHELGDTSFDLVGFSLGAVVAMDVAAQLGEQVHSLVSIAGWAHSDQHQQLRNQTWFDIQALDDTATRHFMAVCAFSPKFLEHLEPSLLKAAIDSINITPFVVKQMKLNACVDIIDQTANITADTLIIACHDDMMVPRHHSQQLFGLIDKARYTEVASGHMVVAERPAELISLIDLFTQNPSRYPIGSIIPSSTV